jgi:predicted CXXCH cytochrome family protein
MKNRNVLFLSLLFIAISVGTSGAEEMTCSITACHHAFRKFQYLHKPVGEVKCLDCHRLVGSHPLGGKTSVTLKATGADLCFSCHKKFPAKKTVHPPVKEGACTSCHNPHGAAGRNLIDADQGQTGFCTKCHDAKMFNKKNIHPPVEEGKCTACHDPHQADGKSLLYENVPKLCLKCHSDVMKKLEGAAVAHPPVRQGRCVACHDPHSSAAKYLLKGEPGQFCVTCHTKIGKTVSTSKVQHGPLAKPESCLSCHSGHTSAVKNLLPAAGKDFCLRCHAKIAASLEGKKMLHGPIKEGKCIPCHDPHGSPNTKLLKGAYPEPLYVLNEKGSYAFCLGCHQKYLLTYPDTSIYTKFRNGKYNLHYFHVAKMRKGRTCRVCHEPHGADATHLLRKEGAEFGEWRVPLGFKETPTGGSCSPGCHGTYYYDRSKPVKYR